MVWRWAPQTRSNIRPNTQTIMKGFVLILGFVTYFRKVLLVVLSKPKQMPLYIGRETKLGNWQSLRVVACVTRLK